MTATIGSLEGMTSATHIVPAEHSLISRRDDAENSGYETAFCSCGLGIADFDYEGACADIRKHALNANPVSVPKKPRRNLKSAKAAGSWMEKAVAEFLAFRLADDRIERRTKNGSKDRGDITGVKTIRGGRVVIECKNVKTLALPQWIREAEIERGNDDALIGVVAHKKTGSMNPADQYVTMTLETFAVLLEGGGDL